MCCGWTGEDVPEAEDTASGAAASGIGFGLPFDGGTSEVLPYLDALTSPKMVEIYRRGAEAADTPPLRDFSGLFMGVPSGGGWSDGSADWEGLLVDAAWLINTMNPVSDINDAVTGSERFSQGLLGGGWQEAVGGLADIAGGLLGIAVPGHYSQYKEGAERVSREIDDILGNAAELPSGGRHGASETAEASGSGAIAPGSGSVVGGEPATSGGTGAAAAADGSPVLASRERWRWGSPTRDPGGPLGDIAPGDAFRSGRPADHRAGSSGSPTAGRSRCPSVDG